MCCYDTVVPNCNECLCLNACLCCIQEYDDVFKPPTALKELHVLCIYLHSKLWSKALHKEHKPLGARRITHRTRELQGLYIRKEISIHRCTTVDDFPIKISALRVHYCSSSTLALVVSLLQNLTTKCFAVLFYAQCYVTERIAIRRKLFTYDTKRPHQVISHVYVYRHQYDALF
jgi:hypothetical protein